MAVTIRALENFVGGEWVQASSDHVREIVSPVTGEVIAEAPDASSADIDRAVVAARAAQPAWAARTAWERAEICHSIADLIEERREQFAHALTLEQGKPYAAEGLPDIDETAENFRIAAEDVKRMETAIIPSRDADKRILTFRKANGVYAAITPWNFPTLIPVELIAPGIAAGNTLVVKPSEWTPVAMANFMQIMADAGLPEGVVNVVYGGGEVGELLVTHPGVDCIGFVGSHTTAEKIVRAAGLKRSLIEASGNGPVIVCEDADLRAPLRAQCSAASSVLARCAARPSESSFTSAFTTRFWKRSSRWRRSGASAILRSGDDGRADEQRADRPEDGQPSRGRSGEGSDCSRSAAHARTAGRPTCTTSRRC